MKKCPSKSKEEPEKEKLYPVKYPDPRLRKHQAQAYYEGWKKY